MENSLMILTENQLELYVTADDSELIMLKKAADLLNLNYPEHALLELWNASVHNLRRRIEIYSIDIFLSTTASLPGRKTYKRDGDTLSERWSGVDDSNLIEGAIQTGVLNKKAGKALEMINWMRNHASPSHDSDDSVTKNDILGLAVILKSNLFDFPLPDPAHSPVSLLEPIKNNDLTEHQVELFKEQIDSFSNKDIRTIFGYAIDVISAGEEPEYGNILLLFNNIWSKATEELKTNMGLRLHNYMFDPTTDMSSDSSATERIYDALLNVNGIKYIPDSTRATIYRKLAKDLANAKNTSYGWALENSASRALKQIGIHVPSIAFEDVYQEILSVWCGNYWGRSDAHSILNDFIFSISPKKQVAAANLFQTNDRVKSELYQSRPKHSALALLDKIKEQLRNASQIAEIDNIINYVKSL